LEAFNALRRREGAAHPYRREIRADLLFDSSIVRTPLREYQRFPLT
jgi:hypothetical protein